MKFIKIFILLFSTFAISATAKELSITDFTLQSEYLPPINYEEYGKPKGIAVELLEKIYEQYNLTMPKINFDHWEYSLKLALKNPKVILFSVSYSEKRKDLFKWVGPIIKEKNSLIGLNSNNIVIDNFDDIKKYKIGVITDDIGYELIKDNASKDNILKSRSFFELLKKLHKNEIDLISYSENSARARLKALGKDLNNYKSFFTFQEDELYFAFHKDTPQPIIDDFQKKFDEVTKKDHNGVNFLQFTINKYLD